MPESDLPIRCAEARPAQPSEPRPASTIPLTYEERYARRRVLVAASGERLLLDLPEARALEDGEHLVAEDGRHFMVVAAPEALAEARGPELARYAWHVGNRHMTAQIERDRLLVRRDHVLEDMLRRLGARVRPVVEPFRPEGGAYGHGRTHDHGHHEPGQGGHAHG